VFLQVMISPPTTQKTQIKLNKIKQFAFLTLFADINLYSYSRQVFDPESFQAVRNKKLGGLCAFALNN
jgi:hypothetical protein